MFTERAYKRVLPQFARKDWEFVAFTADYIVLRIERQNIKFNRSTGAILDRFDLDAGGKRNPR